MTFLRTVLKDAFILEPQTHDDHRGSFSRVFCEREFEQQGISFRPVQCNLSFNKKKGTVRGIHYQSTPYEEAKLVSCYTGAIFDVIIDLRPESPTYTQHFCAILSAENSILLYIPKGFAHGFQTLEDQTRIMYLMSEFYHSSAAKGVRWDDPFWKIDWPQNATIISERDQTYPNFVPVRTIIP